jgi:small subunit ribosomal protein S8
MTDPIADLLTRLRNAAAAGHETCEVAGSRTKERVLRILEQEGYLESWSVRDDGPARRVLTMSLKYRPDGSAAIRGLERVSRPGRRVYCAADKAPRVLNGLGVSILSTSRGLLTDSAARKLGVGGEVLCNVW